MTIYEILKKDHRQVGKMFKEALKILPEDPQKAKEIFDKIKVELVAHAKAEEEAFYLPVKNRTEKHEEEADVLEGKEEHHVVALLIKELSQLEPSVPEWEAKLTVLHEVVDHHVKEEESDIFHAAKDNFTREEARQMAVDMEKARAKYKAQINELLNKESAQLSQKI